MPYSDSIGFAWPHEGFVWSLFYRHEALGNLRQAYLCDGLLVLSTITHTTGMMSQAHVIRISSFNTRGFLKRCVPL